MIKYQWQFIIRTTLLSALLFITLIDWRVPSVFAQIDTLIVAVTETAPPFVLKNDQGELTGFDIDLMNLVAERAGFHVTFRTEQVRYLLSGVATHFYDIGSGCVFITPERQAWVNFSKPYFASGLTLVVKAEDTTITQLSDLTAEMTLGVAQRSLGESMGRNQTQAVVIPATTAQEALAQVEVGNVNAALIEEGNFFDYQQIHPENKLKTVGGLLTYNECGFAVPQDKPELLAKLNIALTQLQSAEDGSYAALYKKWFGQRPLPEKPVEITAETLSTAVPSPKEESATTQPENRSSSTIINTTNGSTTVITNVAELVGIYYLKTELPTVASPASGTTADRSNSQASAPEASNYQLITLAENGLWFISESVAATGSATSSVTGPATGNSQPGLWQVNEQEQVEATLMVFSVSLESQTNVVHKEYQMVIAADGSVAGHYTITAYQAEDFAQSVTGTPLLTQTVEFTGKRVR